MAIDNYAWDPTISACGDYYLLVNKVFGPDTPSLFISTSQGTCWWGYSQANNKKNNQNSKGIQLTLYPQTVNFIKVIIHKI